MMNAVKANSPKNKQIVREIIQNRLDTAGVDATVKASTNREYVVYLYDVMHTDRLQMIVEAIKEQFRGMRVYCMLRSKSSK